MLRVAQQNYVQQEYVAHVPTQLPRRNPPASPFLNGIGMRLGNGKEIPPQEQLERNLHLAAENILLQMRESEIQHLLHDIDRALPIASPQTRQKLQDWRIQFSDHKNMDTKKLAFFLGFLYVDILSDEKKNHFEQLEDSCLNILKLILNLDLEDYLEICLVGISEEREFHQQMNRVDRETQVKIAALNQVVHEKKTYMQMMFVKIKQQLLLLQRNRQARFDAAEEQLNLLHQRVNGAQEQLLVHLSKLEQLGEQESKIAPKLNECCDLLEGVGRDD